jgi:hypothetical protein
MNIIQQHWEIVFGLLIGVVLLLLFVIITQYGTIKELNAYWNEDKTKWQKYAEATRKFTSAQLEEERLFSNKCLSMVQNTTKSFSDYCNWVHNYYPEVNKYYDEYYKAKKESERVV